MCTEGPNILSDRAVSPTSSAAAGVYDNFDHLTQEIEILGEIVKQLGEKVGPILRDGDGTVPESSLAIDPNSSTLAFNIAQRAARVREMRGAVTDLISRIDL